MQYDYESLCAELAQRIKQLRRERGVSQRTLSIDYGFHLKQLNRIESGSGISLQTILKLCAALDVTIEDLLGGIGRVQPEGDSPPAL